MSEASLLSKDPPSDSTCRVCLKKQDANLMVQLDKTYRFNTLVFNEEKLFSWEPTLKKYYQFTIQEALKCLDLQIDAQDGKPQTMCPSCYEVLKKAVKFRMTYLHSQEILEKSNQRAKTLLAPAVVVNVADASKTVAKCEPEFVNIDEIKKEEPFQCDGTEEKFVLEEIECLSEYEDIVYGQHSSEQLVSKEDTINLDSKGQVQQKDNSNSSAEILEKVLVPQSDPEAQKSLPEQKISTELNETEKDVTINCEVDEKPNNLNILCYMCDSKFASMEDHKTHIDTVHVNDDPFKCYICKKDFSSILAVHKHIYEHRQTDYDPEKGLIIKSNSRAVYKKEVEKGIKVYIEPLKPLQCSFCKIVCDDAKSLEDHLKQSHSNRIYDLKRSTCIVCNLVFSSKPGLVTHFESDHKDITIECKECPRTYTDIKVYLRHYDTSHKDTIKCRYCSKTCSTKQLILKHERTHTGERPYLCNLCGKKFTNHTTLAHHIRLHSGERPHICQECGKGFAHTYVLKAHYRLKHSDNQYQCHNCGEIYKNKQNLQIHIKSKCSMKSKEDVEDQIPYPYPCTKCHRKFKFLHTLNRHLENHSGGRFNKRNLEKTHVCPECDMEFKYRQTLNHHLETHNEKRDYPCDQCRRSYKRPEHLRIHIKAMHNPDRPHKCSFCDKSFVTPRGLKSHIMIHTGEKPFECDVCGKAFRGKAHLKEHIFKHTGEKPYKCEECPAKFNKCSYLYKHLAKHEKYGSDLNPPEDI